MNNYLKKILIIMAFLNCSCAQSQEAPRLTTDESQLEDIPFSVLNNGRPENFYRLSFANTNQESLCSSIIDELNKPRSRALLLEAPGVYYANALLNSNLSVNWSSVPYFYQPDSQNSSRREGTYPANFYLGDIDRDGIPEYLVRLTGDVNFIPVQSAFLVSESVLSFDVDEISPEELSELYLQENNFLGRINDVIRSKFEEYTPSLNRRDRLSWGNNYLDLMNFNDQYFVLVTTRNWYLPILDTFVSTLTPQKNIEITCRFTSFYNLTE